MKIKCIHCGEYFMPDKETIQLISDGEISILDIDTCDECTEMLNNYANYLENDISDADPGL